MQEQYWKRIDKRLAVVALYIAVFINFKMRRIGRTGDGVFAVFYLFKAFNAFSFMHFLEFAGAYFLLKWESVVRNGRKQAKSLIIPAVLYAFFMVEGRGFAVADGIQFFGESAFYAVECLLVLSAYTILFYAVFNLISSMLQKGLEASEMKAESKVGKWTKLLNRHPFWVFFALLLICYIPSLIASYPAIFTGDTIEQIEQGYSISNYYPYVIRTFEDSKLVNHHPVVHTLLIHGCLSLGQTVFKSWNAGMFIYICVQTIVSIAVYAYALTVLYRKTNLKKNWVFAVFLYFVIHPRIQTNLSLITKDILYSSFLLLMIVLTYELLIGEKKKSRMLLWIISLVLMIIFRNEGIYIAAASLFILLFNKTIRKKAAAALAVCAVFFVLWNQVVLPLGHVNKGSIREMLSIPFQQTARYVRDCRREVEPEEKEAISKVLPYEILAGRYDPLISDPVKNTYKEEATREDLKEYFDAWLSMGKKHPEVYISALIENKWQFFCPELVLGYNFDYAYTARVAVLANNVLREIETDFSYPECFLDYRMALESIREGIFTMPILGMFRSACFYVWVLLFWAWFCLMKKSAGAFAITMPLNMTLLVLIAGPTNGYYFRYMAPFITALPFVVLYGFQLLKNKEAKSEIVE